MVAECRGIPNGRRDERPTKFPKGSEQVVQTGPISDGVRASFLPVDVAVGVKMRRCISAKDFPKMHASLRSLQRLVERVLPQHKREGAFDGIGLSSGTEHGLRARELRVIELEMFVSPHGAGFHGLSSLDFESLCTLDAEGALPPRVGDLQSCWNEMAGIRC